MLVKATLIKKATDDGLVTFLNHVPLGRVYIVDTDTIQLQVRLEHHCGRDCQHRPLEEIGAMHTKDIISTPEGLWLPMECLSLDSKELS